MRHKLSVLSTVLGGTILLMAGQALAGAGGAPPGGGGGGSGSEPEIIALVLFSLVPGIYFARKALLARREAERA